MIIKTELNADDPQYTLFSKDQMTELWAVELAIAIPPLEVATRHKAGDVIVILLI